MMPASRLRLKRPTGWFAAGQEVAAALPLLSDAAFKLYVFLCLNVNRHSARKVWEPMELANLLQRDRPSMTDALEELCRREVCIRHPDAEGRIAIEICDRFWPYEKPPVEESGIDQNRYVQQVRQMLTGTACMRVNFSAADERLAGILYQRSVTLVQLQRAIWLGCARKYIALLNGNGTLAHVHHQLELLLRPGERGRRNVGGRGLLEVPTTQSEANGKDVAGSNPAGSESDKRRNDGNEIMLLSAPEHLSRPCFCAGA